VTHGARAANHGNAGTGAGAEKGNLQWRVLHAANVERSRENQPLAFRFCFMVSSNTFRLSGESFSASI
jgi:hypothetical protein